MAAHPRRGKPSDAVRPTLEAVLEHYGVRLTTRNTQMVLCPVHGERGPSCSVRLDVGVWHCHACGKGGDAYTLIMEREGVDFAGAVTFAADLGFATEAVDGGSGEVSGSAYAGRSTVASRKGDQKGDRKYRPSWRRD